MWTFTTSQTVNQNYKKTFLFRRNNHKSIGSLAEYKIDQLNDLSAHLATKESDLIEGKRRLRRALCLALYSVWFEYLDSWLKFEKNIWMEFEE